MNSFLFALSTSTFGSRHLLVLCVCSVYAFLALFFLQKKRPSMQFVERCMLIIGAISESIKVLYYIVINEETHYGYLPKTDLPFHLCSIQLIFFVVLNITKNKNLKKVLYSLMLPTCLLGGFFALLLPTTSARELLMITVQYFLYHTSILVFAVYLYITDEFSPTFKDYQHALLFLAGLGFVAIYLNGWIVPVEERIKQGVNFMYVVAPPAKNLPFLNKNHGWLVYFVHYAFLAVTCVSACYIKPILQKIKEKIKK